jgi:hypothetical protein
MGWLSYIILATASILVTAWLARRALAGPFIFKTRLHPLGGFWVFDLQMAFGLWSTGRTARQEISIYVTSKTCFPSPGATGGKISADAPLSKVEAPRGGGARELGARTLNGNQIQSRSEDWRMPVRAVINRINSNSSV